MNELEFLWIDKYININKQSYNNLIKVFKNINNIYTISRDRIKFLNIIKKHRIRIDSKYINRLISEEIKYNAKIKYNYLKTRNVTMITINDKYLGKLLYNSFIMFAFGDTSILRNKIIYMYNSNNISKEAKTLLNNFSFELSKNNISVMSDLLNDNTNVLFTNNLKFYKRENLVCISFNIDNSRNINYTSIINIPCAIFYPNINYDLKATILVDLFLEYDKYILTTPGSIYDKDSYFSNFIIKCGAICITSKTDFIKSILLINNYYI